MEAREGLKVKAVRRDGDVVDGILQALRPRTRLVSISHVGFDDGALFDAARLCASAGAGAFWCCWTRASRVGPSR